MPSNRESTSSPTNGSSGSKGKVKASESRSKSSSQKSAADIRHADYLKFLQLSLQTHAGYLCKPLQTLSASLTDSDDLIFGLSPLETIAGILAVILFTLHLTTPTFLIPHLSAMVTLIIPLQNTIRSINLTVKKNGAGASQDSPQWCAYWLVFIVHQVVRDWLNVFRPGWSRVYEIARTIGLIMLGGPWFGHAAMVSIKKKDLS